MRNRRSKKRRKIKNGGNGNGNGNNGNGHGDEKINSLEWHMSHFAQPCEACNQINVVHSLRQKSKKFKKAVRGHCENKECKEWMDVITYVESSVADISMATCEVCNAKITIIGSRGNNAGFTQSVFGVCTTDGCREKGHKFCYMGAKIQIPLMEKEPINKSLYPPLFVVPKRRGEKRVPYKNDVVKMQRQVPLRARA